MVFSIFSRFFATVLLAISATVVATPGFAQEEIPPTEQISEEKSLQFTFSGATWPEVLQWFAEQSDLSLQMNAAPTGTVNFVDPTKRYSVTDGLDLINRLLLDRGWAVVRRGRMLLLVDLEADNASKLISEMAELVTPEDFGSRGNSDIVRCVFPMGGLTPDAAREELGQIIGPWGQVTVLAGARQVVVTETVGKLKTISEVLAAAQEAQSSVVEIKLQHRAAEEVLEIARPLLGLEPGLNIGEDIRLSVSIYGDRIFATGDQSKLSLLEGIVTRADTPLPGEASGETTIIAPVLRTHTIDSADLQTVFDVLQTLIAGTPDARMGIDAARGAIIVSARPETQELIQKTIAELEGTGNEFTIIDLQRLEPAQALLTINKFFGVTAEGTTKGPVVDGDPVTGRLWVRGTTTQIETVKKLIADLENDPLAGGLGDNVRILPLTGTAAKDMVEQLQSIWPLAGRGNSIRVITPANDRLNASPNGESRTRSKPMGTPDQHSPPPIENDTTSLAPDAVAPVQQLVWQLQAGSDEAELTADPQIEPQNQPEDESAAEPLDDVIIQMTSAGLVIASRDSAALDLIEQLVTSLGSPSVGSNELPTIFWLKFIKADVAAELVAGVLGGADSASGSAGSLAESVVGGLGGGMLGGLLGMGGGGEGDETGTRSLLTSRGSVNIVPDNRLNALIVQAPSGDLDFIRVILTEIDREESPEDIQTISQPALIPVIYQDAKEVAEIVKAVFAEKMGAKESSGQSRQPSPQDFFAALRGGSGGRGGGGGGGEEKPKSEPTKIIVAVDVRSNALVVTATPQDFKMVQSLVETLDQQGLESEQSVQVIPIGGNVRPEVMQKAIESVLGKTVTTTAAASTPSSSGNSGASSSSSSSGSSDGPSSDEIRQRIEFFRSRFGSGGGPPSGFGGGPPGGFGGGAPGGFGSGRSSGGGDSSSGRGSRDGGRGR